MSWNTNMPFRLQHRKKVIVVAAARRYGSSHHSRRTGHSVTLYEKNSRLGGQLLSEQYIPFKQDMYNFVKVLEGRLAKSGVDVRLNTELTAEQAAAENADVIITAIGAKPIVPPIPGIDNEKVVGLTALHQPEPALGQKVVILGGGLVGSECAIYLDGLGKDVTIVENERGLGSRFLFHAQKCHEDLYARQQHQDPCEYHCKGNH